jgi:hypothetical protein
VKVQVRVEDGHGGRLEEEDELDPDEMLHPEVLGPKFYFLSSMSNNKTICVWNFTTFAMVHSNSMGTIWLLGNNIELKLQALTKHLIPLTFN